MAEVHLHQIARVLGTGAAVAAIALIALGLMSYTFVETDGVVIAAQRKRVKPVGEYISGRGSDFAQNATLEDIDICYRYRVGAPIFESCRLGFGVSHVTLAPLSRDPWETLRAGEPVRVYYLRRYPNIAVLHRGPDWIMSIGLALLAIFLFVVAGRIALWERPPDNGLKGRRAKRVRP